MKNVPHSQVAGIDWSCRQCHRFVGIPTTLDRIAKNTTKKKPAARKSAASNS